MAQNNSEEKPQRLYFKSYLKVIENSVGTRMFKNLYVYTKDKGEFDAMNNGEDSCAFYVSSVLVIFGKNSRLHGTVESTLKDLKESGWQEVSEAKPGDVLVWETQKFGDRWQAHIGFYIGKDKAVSTSWKQKEVIMHHKTFEDNRKIEHIFRMTNWDDKS